MSEDNGIFVLKREAAKEPFRFDIEGTRFEVPHYADANQFEWLSVFTTDYPFGDMQFILAAFEFLMAPKQYAQLRKAAPTQPEIEALWDAYQKHCGVKSGESSASPA